MAKQFIVKDNEIKESSDEIFKITGSQVKHIQVLRYNVGDKIKINGNIYEIVKMTKNEIFTRYIEKQISNKRNIEVTLYLAVLKNEMMQLAIKKAVELGVDKIVPFYSRNVVVNLDKKEEKKKEKFENTVIEAVKQCGRSSIPIIEEFKKIEELEISNNDLVFLAYEKEKYNIREVIKDVKKESIERIGIIIGPEGGFEEYEIDKLKKNLNVKVVGLGSRILRAETAAMSMLSIINYEFEEEK